MTNSRALADAKVDQAAKDHHKALAAFKAKTGDFDALQAASETHQRAIDGLQAIIRREYCTCENNGDYCPNCEQRINSIPPALNDAPEAWAVKDYADGWIICKTEQGAKRVSAECGDALIMHLVASKLMADPLDLLERCALALHSWQVAHFAPSFIDRSELELTQECFDTIERYKAANPVPQA